MARFAAIAGDWDTLAAEHPTPFLLSAWILAWWRALAGPRGLRVAVLWRDGQVAAGLPLVDGRRRWEAPVRFALPPLFAMLAVDAAARERLAAEVLGAAPAEVHLRALHLDDPTFDSLSAVAGAARWRTLPESMDPELVTETTGSVEDYRAGLSSKVRSEVGRLRRKAEREHAVEVAALAEPHDLESQWHAVLGLEAAGWKGRNGTAVLQRPDIEAFFAELTRELHAAGALRLSELTLDGGLAAVAMSIVHRERVFTLKVAYDERHRKLGPGFVLLMAIIERCFELGLSAYEFSGPEEEYERRFSNAERPRSGLRIYSPGVAGRSAHAYRRHLRPRLRDARAAARGVAGRART